MANVTLEMQIHHRTDDAILASDDGERRHAVWLPRSEITFEPTKRPIYQVAMPVWLARDKGLI